MAGPFPPVSSGSAPLVTEVTYCIRPSEEGYGALLCAPHSHSGPASASLASPAVQQPGSPHPLLIPQSHQARFLEDAISTTSTHRAGALCSSRARRVIDLVRRLHPPPPPSCSAIIAPLPASPQAASLRPVHPTLRRPAKNTSLPSLHLGERLPAVHFSSLPALLNGVQRSGEP